MKKMRYAMSAAPTHDLKQVLFELCTLFVSQLFVAYTYYAGYQSVTYLGS